MEPETIPPKVSISSPHLLFHVLPSFKKGGLDPFPQQLFIWNSAFLWQAAKQHRCGVCCHERVHHPAAGTSHQQLGGCDAPGPPSFLRRGTRTEMPTGFPSWSRVCYQVLRLETDSQTPQNHTVYKLLKKE